MKQCFKCNMVKSINNFYKHKEMKDGYLNKCKDCAKKDIHENYIKNMKDPVLREKERKRCIEKCKRFKYSSKEYRMKNPEKYKAHSIVRNCIRNGTLIKEPCRICGNIKSDAHHFDYNFPLNVHWYCSKHHKRIHKFMNYKKTIFDGEYND